jgi:hypothetical protein
MKANLRTVAMGAALVATGSIVWGCCKASSPWSIDSGYSDALLAIGQAYKITTGQDAAMTVDSIQLFGPPDPSVHYETVEEIRKLPFLYESSDRDLILRLFASIRDRRNDIDCGKLPNGGSLFILAYDRDLMRVGCLKYYDCSNASLGAITAYGSGSALFSSKLREVLGPLRMK